MDKTYLIIAGLCLLAFLARTGYELLKQAGRVDTKNPVVFAAIATAMGVFLMSWPFFCPLDPWRIALPAVLSRAGLVLVAVALVLAVGGLIQLRGVENIDHLVTTGLYSKFRHPMYAGFILWIAGWVVFNGAAISLALGLVCVPGILFWQRLEETALEAQFGEAYRVYKRQTWF
ncbi:MAG: NnrU family protein [candidate division FCPU426 bacterium]